MSNLISIIVPMHNVEPYLSQCLSSLQAMKPVTDGGGGDTEFIIIDDKSTDRSVDIAEEFAAQDKRFKVYHSSTNGGSSASRNAGLEFAKGNYIGFVDSDDYVDENYISLLYESLIKNDADICVCNIISGKKPWLNLSSEMVFEDNAIMGQHIRNGFYGRVFNKLYTRKVISDVRFPVGRDFREDALFTTKVMLRAQKVCRIPQAPYHYRYRRGSIAHSAPNYDVSCGFWINSVEMHAVLFSNINKTADLNRVSVHYLYDFQRFLTALAAQNNNIFKMFKAIAVLFQSKIRPHVAPSSHEEEILNLLLNEEDINVVKQKLTLKEASP